MSEGVPTDVPQAQLATGRTDVILLDWAGMVTASGHRTGENPVFLRLGTLPFPVEQNGSEIGIEREIRTSASTHTALTEDEWRRSVRQGKGAECGVEESTGSREGLDDPIAPVPADCDGLGRSATTSQCA